MKMLEVDNGIHISFGVCSRECVFVYAYDGDIGNTLHIENSFDFFVE